MGTIQPRIYSYTRYSIRRQARGDSTRRQFEAADAWALQHGQGMPLDISLREPRDVSAYRGYNAKAGSLAKFFHAIKAGEIAPGSVLILENLDRLSRNEPLEGLDAMRSIIGAGVDIVTLHDGQRFTRDNMRRDIGTLISALVVLTRAFEESDTKSKRLAEKWAQKRGSARKGFPITIRVPPWLKVVGSKLEGSRRDWSGAKCVSVPDRVTLVQQIFNWSIDGWGYRRIAMKLKTRRVPHWGRADWSPSTIAKIIKSRAVLGEFQPHIYEGGAHGQRRPSGEVVKGYFPRVIEDDLWEQAQPHVTQHPHGRGAAILSGLLVDARNRRMHYMITGAAKNKVAYVKTAHTHTRPGEVPPRWRAAHLEACVLRIVQGIDWERVYADQSQAPEIARLKAEIHKVERSEVFVRVKIEKAAEVFLDGGVFADEVRSRALQHETELTGLRGRRTALRRELDALRRTNHAAGSGITFSKIPDDTTARERLNRELRSLLKSVKIWPDGRTADSVRDVMYEQALAQTSVRAKGARKAGRVMGAIRFIFSNEKAITAYVGYMPGDRKLRGELIGFADPTGMNLEDWAQICSHAAWQVAPATTTAVTT